MKTKINLLFICMLLFFLIITITTNAQQPANTSLASGRLRQMNYAQPAGNYSFHIFMTSNKTYGYDILSNARIIYHQPAFSRIPGDNNVVIMKKEHANIAAMVAIEKIKRGKNPQLSNEELKKIISH